MSLRKITLLGATGSIGSNTLDVIGRHPERFEVFALTANRQVEAMLNLCCQWRPKVAVMADAAAADQLRQRLADLPAKEKPDVQVLAGTQGLCEVAEAAEVDVVVAAIVGAAGLPSTLAAVRAGKRVLLANKESLVMSGALLMASVAGSGAVLLPIDSEHNAIFQCLPYQAERHLDQLGVRRILLTASGGPFRAMSLADLAHVTPDQACAHPNWRMGRKISVDSATLMNKGLELIEACWLFNTTPAMIDVHVHPQSIIHSMVEYADGSVLAQLGSPDMRTPIANGLAWPERIDAGVAPLDLFRLNRFDFERPDLQRFPCLALASQAFAMGGTAPALLNAANEVAVAAFLAGGLPFTEIPVIIERVLSSVPTQAASSFEIIFEADARARNLARQLVYGEGSCT